MNATWHGLDKRGKKGGKFNIVNRLFHTIYALIECQHIYDTYSICLIANKQILLLSRLDNFGFLRLFYKSSRL